MASSGRRDGEGELSTAAKAIVGDQLYQTIQSTSNLLHLMQQSSPSQVLGIFSLPLSLLSMRLVRTLSVDIHFRFRYAGSVN